MLLIVANVLKHDDDHVYCGNVGDSVCGHVKLMLVMVLLDSNIGSAVV